MKKRFDPLTAKGLVWRDQAAAKKILSRYRKEGKELLHFVWDWDGTLVPTHGFSWQVMANTLPAAGRRQHIQLYNQYKPMEDRGELTRAKERAWSESALKLHVKHRTPLKVIEEEAGRVKVRRYAELAFAVCERAAVPTIILSAGIKDVIDLVARKHRIHPTAVLGAELFFTKEGLLTGWKKDSLVDAKTKREMGHPDLTHIRNQHPNAVLFGDQPQDAGMLSGPALRIRINGTHAQGTEDWEVYLKESWEAGYDAVTTDDHLLVVARLNQWLVGS
jgi:phosphoserine phosphatase